MTTIVITGASAGVGRAVTRRFAQDGVKIGLIARGRERLDAAAEEARDAGGEAVTLPCDVADPDAVEAAAEQAEEALGPIDIWINAAMATILSPFHRMGADEFHRVTEVTYLGCVHGTLAALRRMRIRGHGTIVQIGSALAYRSIPLQSAYCGAKHAIVGFTDSIRSELIHDGSQVTLSVVHLPAVNTPQFTWMRNRMPRRPQPLPPIFQPEVVADAIHYIAHNPRREFWIGGSAWKAILAQKLAPGLLDHYLASAAWNGQMTEEAAGDTPDNLFGPASGEFEAHGPFDGRATGWSPMTKAAEHCPGLIGAAALGIAVAAGLTWAFAPRHQ